MKLITLQSIARLLSASTTTAAARNDYGLWQNTTCPTLIEQHLLHGNKVNQVDNASSRFGKVFENLRLPAWTNLAAKHDNKIVLLGEDNSAILPYGKQNIIEAYAILFASILLGTMALATSIAPAEICSMAGFSFVIFLTCCITALMVCATNTYRRQEDIMSECTKALKKVSLLCMVVYYCFVDWITLSPHHHHHHPFSPFSLDHNIYYCAVVSLLPPGHVSSQ
jgi:hypothetical protein